MLALRDLLNSGEAGDYRCVYANFEVGQAAREDTARAMRALLSQLAARAEMTLDDETPGRLRNAALADAGPDGALFEVLSRWARADPRPLVLLIDEIDTLVGDTLLSVLRQLRAGYDQRPGGFPHSVILCGVRDVRDYRVHSTARNALVLGGSAFNIKSASLRLGDFTAAETRALLAQHTAETGQAFAPAALEAIRTRTAGQPWLVNALCREACFKSRAGRDRSRAITEGDILDAQERLILARVTHLDNLADKLREERVRRVVLPMLTGAADRDRYSDRDRDVEYARDLGLLAQHDAKRIANPIYAEVIPRELTWIAQDDVDAEAAWFVDADGGLNVDKLLAAFQQILPRALGALDAALRPLPGGRAATAAAGIPAEGGQRRRACRAGVCPGPGARGPADRLAARRMHPPVRGGVQGARRRAGSHCPRGGRADAGLHGPLRSRGGPPDRFRPLGDQDLGGENLPPKSAGRRPRAGYRLGHVTTAPAAPPPSIARRPCPRSTVRACAGARRGHCRPPRCRPPRSAGWRSLRVARDSWPGSPAEA